MAADEADILTAAETWKKSGRGVAIATVLETWGSAPRPVGAHLVVDDTGLFLGSVSGGCVEGEVLTAAQDAIEAGAPRELAFGVADETAWRAGLSCGGRIVVRVESLDAARLALLVQINAARAARRAVALVTPMDGGAPRLFHLGDAPRDAVEEEIDARLRADKSGVVTNKGRRVFIETHCPPARLIIVGAVHVAQALEPMAKLCGLDALVIDPREAFATVERFPSAHLLAQWPDEVLSAIDLDAFTAVVTLTHDPKIDDLALRIALASDCFYVGALGSKVSHAQRVKRLLASGVSEKSLSRLRAPIGLDIGAVSPAEIAVSIIGEIILARQRKPLRTDSSR